MEIVDFSYGRPGGPRIKDAGYVGAMRYLGYDGRCLTSTEAKDLLAADVPIGLVYETQADRALSGADGGRQDAARANALADQCGAPDWVPIFGTVVDFEAFAGQIAGSITQHALAAKAASKRPWGGYGNYVFCEILGQNQTLELLWQCCAWSYFGEGSGGSVQSPGESQGRKLSQFACMFQKLGYVLNDTCDANVAVKPITWLWTPSGRPVDTPEPPAVPPVEEEDMSKTIMVAEASTGRVFEVEMPGIFKRYVINPDEMAVLAIHGVPWLGEGDQVFMDARVAVPFDQAPVTFALTAEQIAGLKGLTGDEIQAFAQKIVDELKARL